MNDQLGQRMKSQYEVRTKYFLPRRTYTIIRLDGKAFHTYLRGFKKPYDENLMSCMDITTKNLCKQIQGAKFAYVQSDEISILLTDFEKETTDAWFDGNIQKIVSVSASMATGFFNNIIKTDKIAFFDSRTFIIPDHTEVENYFIWRQKDAIRNSIQMTAQSLYSHKELNNKSQSDLQEMIFKKGQNWNDMIEGFKRGRTIIKREDNWILECPDFIKDRQFLINLIPVL
jgi:tRNA(His) 5'-end guanylyltransferase